MGYVRFAVRLWPIFLLGLSLDICSAVATTFFHAPSNGAPMAMILTLSFALNPFMILTPEIYEPETSPHDAELTSEVAELSALAGVPAIPAHRLTGKHGRRIAFGCVKDGKIFVSQRAIDQLPPACVKWILAHEVAHLIRFQERREMFSNNLKLRVAAITLLSILYISFVAFRIYPRGEHTIISLLTMGVCLGLLGWWAKKYGEPKRDLELFCDRRAAELTGDPIAGLEALEVLLKDEKPRTAKANGYPTADERIAQMQALVASS